MALRRGIFWLVAIVVGLGIIGWLATDSPRARAADAKAAAASPEKEPAKEPEEKAEKINPLSVNATCYVCHMTFVREEISKVHFKEKVTCIKCHGLSAAHANDEDIGETKPDIMYKRGEVDAMCVKCHEDHDVPASDVIERFLDRKPPESPTVCTDCHGMHRIQASDKEK